MTKNNDPLPDGTMDKFWFLWEDADRPPPLNMAIDELLLAHSEQTGSLPVLRIYGWDRPSVSFGYSQKYPDSKDVEGFFRVRRPTGGGIVFHGNDLTYTLVIPAGHQIGSLNRLDSYKVVHLAIMKAVEGCGFKTELAESAEEPGDRRLMRCFESPSLFDLMSARDGRKIAGAAQRRTRKGILHQGSISLEVLETCKDEFRKILLSAFRGHFNIGFKPFKIPEGLLGEAEKLASAKFADIKWNEEGISADHN